MLWLWLWLLLLLLARPAWRSEQKKPPCVGGQGPEIRYFRRAFFEGAGVLGEGKGEGGMGRLQLRGAGSETGETGVGGMETGWFVHAYGEWRLERREEVRRLALEDRLHAERRVPRTIVVKWTYRAAGTLRSCA